MANVTVSTLLLNGELLLMRTATGLAQSIPSEILFILLILIPRQVERAGLHFKGWLSCLENWHFCMRSWAGQVV